MRFLNNLRENTLRLIFTLIALYCLTIGLTGFIYNNFINTLTLDDCKRREKIDNVKPERGLYITDIVPGGAADRSGIQEKDILLAINGKEVNSEAEALNLLNQLDVTKDVVYTVYRNNEILKYKIEVYKYFNIPSIIFSLLGLCFIVVGFLVGYSKPKEITSQIFFFLGCCAAMGFSFLPNLTLFFSGQWFLLINNQIGLIFFSPLLTHFFLTYPIKFDSKYRKKIIAFIYLFVILLTILTVAFTTADFMLFVTMLNATLIVYFFFGLVFFLLSYRKLTILKEDQLKKPIKVILRGILLGTAGFLYLYLVPKIFPVNWLINNNTLIIIPAALVLAIPVSFGYSIFRYKILDTEFIVKRSIVFGIITGFVVILYLVLVFIIENLLSKYLTENKQLITISLIVIVTFTFDFVNKRVRNFVEKQFYRERYNYRKSLLQFSEELPYLNDIDEIINKVGSAVKDTIRVKNLNIWIKDQDKMQTNGHGNIYDMSFSYLYKNDFDPKFLNDINLVNEKVPTEYIDLFKENKIVLSVPIVLKGKLKGSLNFGEKMSDKSYSDEDIDLLQSLASQCAVALENSRLQHEEIYKQEIEEELEIAYKIQSDLLPAGDTTFNGLDISASSRPAKSIGGDFYDLIKLSDTKLLVVVADVSGKGIPAALYMSKVQAMIQFAAGLNESPRKILLEVNKQIIDTLDKKNFITTIMALFDLENKKVTISRAGHNPLLIYKNGSINPLDLHGIGLGVGTQALFEHTLEEKTLPIEKDNIFVFYSDGLSEAMDKQRELYGINRIAGIIESHTESTSENLKNTILNSIDSFKGDSEQFDDETIVVVKIK
ncbi:MAG: SpoIIE family protein phosphatase [Ignavibacteriae bacterium]|nr:SpoIIE family protein phosphatase [Ignavibacteriota bacterium]MCB9242920.1 SpoIIE family protein phosphatase [Ignavibacteriales bacterium]